MFKKLIIAFQVPLLLILVGCQLKNVPTNLNEEEVLELIIENISLPEETTVNLELLDSYTYEGYTANATWNTTASNIITSDGIVNVESSNRSAIITLTLEYNGATVKKEFNITVLGNKDYLVLYAVSKSMVTMPIDAIGEDITLPLSYEIDGKIVNATWRSSDESIVSSTGQVTLGNEKVSVELYLTLSYNSVVREEVYNILVEQEPSTLPVNWWHTVSVYTGEIENEASKPYTPNCFPGAIYRKVVSSKDNWLGIEATVTLPEFIPDPLRFDKGKASYFLDNASLYLGGNSYKESDVGLTWSIGYEEKGSTYVSSRGIAYRPFWRYITSLEGCKNNNCYKNAGATDFEYYYYPGDTIQISVLSPKPGYLQLRIELLELTTHPNYINKREDYGLGIDFNRVFISDIFPSAGMGSMPAEFKRVNAIDQVSNEAKPTINTDAKVINSVWREVYLYRMINNELYRVPMTNDRSASMTCPLGSNENGDFSNTFTISYDNVDKNLGGEVVSITPNNGDGTLYN